MPLYGEPNGQKHQLFPWPIPRTVVAPSPEKSIPLQCTCDCLLKHDVEIPSFFTPSPPTLIAAGIIKRYSSASRLLKMRLLASAAALLPFVTSLVSATALTYKLAANEKACFFEDIDRLNSKVAFYFAVCRIFIIHACFPVQNIQKISANPSSAQY